MLISVDQLRASEKRFRTISGSPVRENLPILPNEAFITEIPPGIVTGNILTPDENFEKRKEMLATVKKEPVDFALERAIGKNDSVYSNFVELIEIAKKKVGRIAIKNGNRNIGFATGFLVAENLLLTNWHVFRTIDEVADSEIQFGYEYDIKGNPVSPVSFGLQSNLFFHSNKELDYCLVAVKPTDISGTKQLKDIGYIFLDPSLGKLGNENEEALNIIHHPDGDYKQLSIRENLFVRITPTSIWYQTDTAPGSSGSPVFNDQWQVVALHHMGVAKKNEAGEYVDKDEKPIPQVDGKIDITKVVWIANEGIRVSVILKDLFSIFSNEPILDGLKINPTASDTPKPILPTSDAEKKPPTDNNLNNSTMETNDIANKVTISFPVSLVERNGLINISISQGQSVTPVKSAIPQTTEDIEASEIKKLEDSLDFSLCKGYQSRFLGSAFNVPLPRPQQSIKKFIAKLSGTDSIVLKYFNYSTIFHTVRMMPVISAINVEGDPDKRKDTSERKDVWLRDTRLNFDIQMDDAYYKKSGFDRGHMSRREDADWGANAEDAKRNADLTCMYTNACPQVPKLNQSGKKGLWGILEKIVLESGAERENGKTARISVFNGPIFKDDDPVFRGIQLPMDFYKIVLWLTDNDHLKATAFKLSQSEDVSNIDFEELDIDQNTRFKEFQCSIKSLQKQTKIDFSHLFQFDTFDGEEDAAIALNSEHELLTMIDKHRNT